MVGEPAVTSRRLGAETGRLRFARGAGVGDTRDMSSRLRLGALGALTVLLLSSGCSSGDDSAPEAPLPGPSEWNRKVTPPADDEAQAARSSCDYHAGDLPAETQGKSRPMGAKIPVDHILVMMMENRSFDHYFQKLPEYGQPDVEVAPDSYANPDPNGVMVKPFHDTTYCFVDTNHGWAGTHQQYNDGKMNGFFVSNEGEHELPAHGDLEMLSGKRALGYYDETDLPFYYWLASTFSIADHYHASVPGPTYPNRMFLYAATSFGYTSNSFPSADKLLVDYLEERKIDWKVYSDGTPGMAVFVDKYFGYKEHFLKLEDYFADAEAGTLPSFAFIDPGLGISAYDKNDEHPPAMAPIGQKLAATVIDALTKSPNWSRSALFFTYDEHGGLYDHVPPPSACPPDDIAPKLAADDPVGGFDRLGIRVPMMVISPYAKKHFVAHRTYDHTSIVRFVESRFVLPALTNRDANAEAPWEMFDFDDPPFATPPAITIPEVDPDKVAACRAIFKP